MTKAPVRSIALAVSSVLLLGVVPAYAGADTVRAEAYFNAISGGNAETISSFYADDAEFHWVGGPLAGVYKGKDKIRGVWEKFSKAAGSLNHEVQQLSESVNGKVTTVTARVKFKGEGEVPVKFVMIYKDGKIASEVWQVDKAGPSYAKDEARTVAKSAPKPEAEAKPEASAQAPDDVADEGGPGAADEPAATAAVVTTAPDRPTTPQSPAAAPAPEQVAVNEAAADEPARDDDYLPKPSKTPRAAAPAATRAAPPAAAAPSKPSNADSKAERKTKTAEAPKAKKKRYQEDYDDDEDYGYGGYRRYRGYGWGRDYGYGGDRGYGGWRGYGGGYGGGYGWGYGGGRGGY